MEERSIRENSQNDSFDSESAFRGTSAKFMKKSLNGPFSNISQLSMMNNIHNRPFSVIGKSRFNLGDSTCSTPLDMRDALNASTLNNASFVSRSRFEKLQVKLQGRPKDAPFRMMKQNPYMSPSRPRGEAKNQSVMGRQFKMVSLQAFDYGEKFYSAQKDVNKNKSQEEKNEQSTEKDYKELINTFRNYRGRRDKISTSRSTTTFSSGISTRAHQRKGSGQCSRTSSRWSLWSRWRTRRVCI